MKAMLGNDDDDKSDIEEVTFHPSVAEALAVLLVLENFSICQRAGCTSHLDYLRKVVVLVSSHFTASKQTELTSFF